MSSNESWREWLHQWGVPTSEEPQQDPFGVRPDVFSAPGSVDPFETAMPYSGPQNMSTGSPNSVPPAQPAMDAFSSPQPSNPKQPRQTDPRAKELAKKIGLAALFVVPLIVVVVFASIYFPKTNKEQVEAAPTTTSTTVKVKKWCEPRTGNPYVSDGGGSLESPQGVLAEMERQYFGLRSPSGVVSLTNGQWTTEATLVNSIGQLPEQDIEWCTTITPMEENWWTVIVEWRTKDKKIDKIWVGDYQTEKGADNNYVITGMRPNEEAVKEIESSVQEKSEKRQEESTEG